MNNRVEKHIVNLFYTLGACMGAMTVFGFHGVFIDLGYLGLALWIPLVVMAFWTMARIRVILLGDHWKR